jgi:tetratricopeptide (TPR) repeat protein
LNNTTHSNTAPPLGTTQEQQDSSQNKSLLTLAAIDEHLNAAKSALQKGNLSRAQDHCNTVLAHETKHQEALYTLAVAHRLAQDITAAHATLDRLVAAYPAYGRGYQERGHCYRDTKENAQARTAYQSAVEHNVALLASWRMLAHLEQQAGHSELAANARAQCAYLESLPPELQSVLSLTQEGKLLQAEQLCRAYLLKNRHHTEAMRLLADIGLKFHCYDDAEFLLESCRVLEPDNTNAHFDYVHILNKRNKFAQSLEQATLLRNKAPHNPQFELLYANESLAAGNYEEALDIFQSAIEKNPHNPILHLTLGHALKTLGNQAESVQSYQQAYGLRANFGDAYWSLANLKTYRFTATEMAQMQAQESSDTTGLVDRYHLCFALGKALEDAQDYAQAFSYYERGNRLKREETGYQWQKMHEELALQSTHCSAELFERFKDAGDPAPDPIFILGLPRAGSTLLEQILSSHSLVEGTMELPNILSLAHKLDGRRRLGDAAQYPANLATLTAEDLRNFGAAYMHDTRIHRKQATPYFIDKMPNNFRHIGLIHLILPNAKIIDARRSAMGCCFSGFKQLFAQGQEFTYGLEEVSHYYKDYVELMAHWDNVLPGRVLRVQYEDVVGDIEGQVRRILEFCGLPFEEACVNFHQTERAVRTASSEQVRQPLYTSGVDQWQNFTAYLDPLREVLGGLA